MFTIEHFDPRKHPLVCGLDVEENVSVVDESYNKRKNNRFVPYRVKKYNAPRFFGDIGEFLIKSEWIVCEFGGEEWWAESNLIGNAQVEGGRKGIRSGKNALPGVMRRRALKAIKVNEVTGTGVYGLTKGDLSAAGKIGGSVSASLGYLDYGSENSIKNFDTCSKGGKVGSRSGKNLDPEHIKDRSRKGGCVQGPKNKGMKWYHMYDESGSLVWKRSQTPLPDPWIKGRGSRVKPN
jgi:hypothetical protein